MRLLTRSDFDGLACAVLLIEMGIVDEFKFVHPRDIQNGEIAVTKNDVLANVPFSPGCGLWFDHHVSEFERLKKEKHNFEGRLQDAASAAQIIWEYYGGENAFNSKLLSLLQAVNISDSAALSYDEITNPKDWILLSFMMDPRTGLGLYKDYKISNYQLMLDMIEYCRSKTAEEIIDLDDVKQRINRYQAHQEPFQQMLKQNSRTDENVIVTNLLDQHQIYCGNRFMVYALYQEQNIDIRIMWGKNKQNVVIACGHSILNRSSRTNVGKLMLKYSGGGHSTAGTCQVHISEWEKVSKEIVGAAKN